MSGTNHRRPLAGKLALVTGGSRGIGRAICWEFAARGADVLVHYNRKRSEAEVLCRELQDGFGVRALSVGGDLSRLDEIEAFFGIVNDSIDKLDILVNNAGFEDCHAAESMSARAWDFVMNVNLRAPFLCSQMAFPLMRAAGGGVILNNSSIHDEIPRKGIAHYCSAKAGLRMLTKCLALEWAEYSIRVNTVSPGAIETDMNRHVIRDESRFQFGEWIPAGRAGTVEEVAALFAFLASPEASYITGSTICIDGGYHLSTIRYDDRPGRMP